MCEAQTVYLPQLINYSAETKQELDPNGLAVLYSETKYMCVDSE